MFNRLIMEKYFNSLPEKIQRQIISITRSSSLPYNDNSVEKMTQLWLKKEKYFQEELLKYDFVEVDFIEINDKSGAIIMTYSGSLLKISPEMDSKRQVKYTSIGLRKDVPDNMIVDNVKLAYDIIKDEPIDFIGGKIRVTSPVYKIGVCKKKSSLKEQTDSIDEATDFIMNNFIELNRQYFDKDEE